MRYAAGAVTTVLLMLLMLSAGWADDWEVFVNSNYVTTLWSDSRGIWWGGIYGGVVLYNPETEHFQKTLKAVGELRSNQVRAVAVDQQGAVWVGTAREGVSINDNGAWRFEGTQSLHLLSDNILDISVRGPMVAVATSGGLSIFESGQFVKFFNGNDWAHSGCDSVLAVALDSDRALVGTPCGAFAYSFATETWSEVVARRRTRRIAYDGEALFWMAAGDSIYKFDGIAASIVSKRFVEAELIRDIAAKGASVWIVTNYGPSKYRPVVETWDHRRSGIPDNLMDIQRARFADDGTLWIGTKDGVAFLNDTTWVMVKSPGPASNYVEDLARDGTGTLWFTTGYRKAGPPLGADRGILSYNPSTLEWKQFLAPAPINSNRAYACEASTIDSTVWFGYWDAGVGLVQYNPRTATWKSYRDSLRGRVISDIYFDAAGRMGFCEYLYGAGFRSPEGQFIHYSRADQDSCISSTCMTAVGGGPGGSFMLGNYFVSAEEPCVAEVVRLDLGSEFADKGDDNCERWTPLNNYPQGIATYAFALDPYNVEWIASDGGLGAYDFSCRQPGARNWHRTNVRLGAVWDVKVDAAGNKWVASDQGLYVLRGAGLEWSDFLSIDSFTSDNSPLEDASVKAITFDADGSVWLGTAGGGIYRYEPTRAETKTKSWVDAYPNPYLAFEDACGKGIGFSGAQPGTKIKIFTVAGDLVGEIDAGATWNGRNGNGDEVVSGIYIYIGRAQNGADFKGRIAIIR